MDTLRLLIVLLCSLCLSACQSARLPLFLPAVQHQALQVVAPPHSNTAAAKPEPVSSRAKSIRVPAPRKPANLLADTSRTAAKKPKKPLPTLVISGTDTLVGYPVNSKLPSGGVPPDPATTAINVAGGATILGSLVTLAVLSDREERSGTDWSGLMLSLMAFTILPVGVAMLFFQGPNGRQRAKREARRKGSAIAAPTNATPSDKQLSNPPLRKLGIGILLAGALLMLGGALLGAYGLLFFGLPGLVLLLIGLVLGVAAT
ncbi:hypothetical protein [Hymenobacter metallilatus]|uniref:Uncharacterized protein n=1 Tax=Hymenobacter metallilatus TaxID=2493666 RepID=A0A3R9N691_9BACT|nr:hypothetical protein [Hymenobacter metallilatus]RSK24313.1 hypothetical protein EI290_20070 [Hymenobacter metallilatus]